MLRATEQVFVTQSALSLQMKRLEGTLQAPLFHRNGRRLVLTPTGEVLLTYARDMLALNDRAMAAVSGDALAGPVRVGMTEDFAETVLSGVLSRFVGLSPDVQLQIRVGGSNELLDQLASDRLDIVLCMGGPDDTGALREVDAIWLGEPGLIDREVLPVVVLERPCRFRDAALSALDASGRPYRVVLETPSLSVLRAAVASGVGVTCRTALFGGSALARAEASDLPTLPRVTYVRHVRRDPHPTVQRLGDLLQGAVQDLLSGCLQ